MQHGGTSVDAAHDQFERQVTRPSLTASPSLTTIYALQIGAMQVAAVQPLVRMPFHANRRALRDIMQLAGPGPEKGAAAFHIIEAGAPGFRKVQRERTVYLEAIPRKADQAQIRRPQQLRIVARRKINRSTLQVNDTPPPSRHP
ncbi:hypothetical protein [Novosphingobium sp. Fuku2-ISO-50]|uniref:hypothetical protein n=1 Tax=Novosphingobium sp. Fuku2-ISO-50 TaxID=1739114 RepID=UPI001E62EF9A|nr:hypothetical protein [Novosphingobium sp. Fuku2-ISO-50]